MSDQFVTDPKIERVGEECGAAGPLAAVALLCQAKIQNRGGRVEGTYRQLALYAHCTRDEAVSVLRALVSGDVLELENEDETSFEVFFPAWAKWQDAFRKARKRAEEKSAKSLIQADCDEVSKPRPPVSGARPKKSLTVQDSTYTYKGEFAEWLEHYRETTGRTSVRGSKGAREAFGARRDEGRTLEDLKTATVGAHSDDYLRRNGYDTPDTILRASKVERYIVLGREADADVLEMIA